jgi:hypothetical protein
MNARQRKKPLLRNQPASHRVRGGLFGDFLTLVDTVPVALIA